MRRATRSRKYEDPAFIAWLHEQGCIVTGRKPVTVHHCKRCPGGPREDRRGVPLIAELHMLTHAKNEGEPGYLGPCVERGRVLFEVWHKVNLENEIERLNKRYEGEHNA